MRLSIYKFQIISLKVKKMQLIEELLRIMNSKGIKPAQMERDTGIKQTTFIGWKKGAQPTADKLIKIIEYLDITPNELFGYDKSIGMNRNEREMLDLFRQLPEREQIKFIGRLEDKVSQFTHEE